MAEVHGNRTIASNGGETGVGVQSDAESGAVDAADGLIDSELRTVVVSWPKLPDTTKDSILAMVRAADNVD